MTASYNYALDHGTRGCIAVGTTYPTVNAICELLPRRVPAQTVLVLLVALTVRLRARPRRVRRAIPTRPWHGMISHLPYKHTVAGGARDEGAVWGKGQGYDGRLHG